MRGDRESRTALASLSRKLGAILDERDFMRDVGYVTDALEAPRIGAFIVDVTEVTPTMPSRPTTSSVETSPPLPEAAPPQTAASEADAEEASAAKGWKSFSNDTEAGRLLGRIYRGPAAKKPPPPSPKEITLQSRKRRGLGAPTTLLGLAKPPAPVPFPDDVFASTDVATLARVRWRRKDGPRVRSLRAPRACGRAATVAAAAAATERHPGAPVFSLARFIRAEDFLLSRAASAAMGCGATARGVAVAPSFARLFDACASGAVATTSRWQLLDGSSEWRACTVAAFDAQSGTCSIRWCGVASSATPTRRGRNVSVANIRFAAESEAELALRCAPARQRRRAAETELWRYAQRTKVAEVRARGAVDGDVRAVGAAPALPPTLFARVTARAAACMRPAWNEAHASPASREVVATALAEIQREYVAAMNDEHVAALNASAAAMQSLARSRSGSTAADAIVSPALLCDDDGLDAEIAAVYAEPDAWRARTTPILRAPRIERFIGCTAGVKRLPSFQVHVLMLYGMQRMLPHLTLIRATQWVHAVSLGGRPPINSASPSVRAFRDAARAHVGAQSPNFAIVAAASKTLEQTVLDVYGEAVHAAALKAAAAAGGSPRAIRAHAKREQSIDMEPFYRLLWLVNQMRWSRVQKALIKSVHAFAAELEAQLEKTLGWIVAGDHLLATRAEAADALLACGELPAARAERLAPLNDNDDANAGEGEGASVEVEVGVAVVAPSARVSGRLVNALAAPVSALSARLVSDFAGGPASAPLAAALEVCRGRGAPIRIDIVDAKRAVAVVPPLAEVEAALLFAVDVAVDAARSATVDTPVDIPMMRPLHQIRFLRASPLPRDGVTYLAVRRRIAIAVRAGYAAAEALARVAMRFQKVLNADHDAETFVAAHFAALKRGDGEEDRNTAHTMAVTAVTIDEFRALAATVARELAPFANFGALAVDCAALRARLAARANAVADALIAYIVREAASDCAAFDAAGQALYVQLVKIEDPDSVQTIDEMAKIDLSVDRTDEAVAEGRAFQMRMKARMRVLFDCRHTVAQAQFSEWVDAMLWPHRLLNARRACVLALPPLRMRFRLVVADRKDELRSRVEKLEVLTLKLLRTAEAAEGTDVTWYRGKVRCRATL